jgi:hypothetical protein
LVDALFFLGWTFVAVVMLDMLKEEEEEKWLEEEEEEEEKVEKEDVVEEGSDEDCSGVVECCLFGGCRWCSCRW